MARLNQLQVSYSTVQDRLLLRVNLSDGEEFSFWLTRAMIKSLWPVLYDCTARDPQVQQQATSANRHAVQDFQRQAAVAKTDFNTPYQPPAGKKPSPRPAASLVIATQLSPQKNGLLNLRLKTESNLSMDLNLSNQLLHALMHMLEDSVRKTKWDLNLDNPAQDQRVPGAMN